MEATERVLGVAQNVIIQRSFLGHYINIFSQTMVLHYSWHNAWITGDVNCRCLQVLQ